MRLQDDLDFTTLNWVKHELDETLKEARQALEAFVDDPDDTSQMRFCATYLHQVQGTLRMVELYGAALVVEEMERVALGLIDESVTKQDDVYSVLMRGIVQLPDYLERLQSGHRDIPIVLLPLLNDLRATRGEKLLSENVLFRPNLEVALPASAAGPQAPVPQDKLQAAVTRLRMAFEFGLLKWFRDDDADEILTRLITIADRLRSVTSTEEARRLWWVAGGVLEALLVRGLDPSVSVKLLFGRVDREIKRLVEGGEDSFRQSPPDDLVRSLLYYVAHSQATSRRVTELRETFQLNDLLPDTDEIEHAKGALAGHNRQLLDTVSGAIKEDLLRVKDALDLHLRRDEAGAEDLEPLSRDLDSVADTLGMLGLGVPRKVVLEQRSAIEDMIAGKRPDDEDSLLDIAGALLYVESSLDDHIEALGAPSVKEETVIAPVTEVAADSEDSEDADKPIAVSDSELPQSEVRRILDALIKEAHTNINQAKQEIIAFIEAPWDHSRIVESPRLLEEILGALKMLDLGEPAEVVSGILAYVEEELLDKKEVPTAEELDTLADAVASIEYYLEGVREHRPGRTRVLEVARDSVQRLREGTVGGKDLELNSEQRERLESDDLGAVDFSLLDNEAEDDDSGSDGDDLSVDALSSEDTAREDHSADEDDLSVIDVEGLDFEAPSDEDLADFEWSGEAADDSHPNTLDSTPESMPESAPEPTQGVEVQRTAEESERQRIHDLSNDIDDDIREVFVEEVGEELQNLQDLYPKWKSDVEDEDTLITIRRIFHTLKGSGRLVGAVEIGEFSWKIENMLNRVLDESIGADDQVVALMDHTMEALPQLQAHLEDESAHPTADIAGIMALADRVASGEVAYLDSAQADAKSDEEADDGPGAGADQEEVAAQGTQVEAQDETEAIADTESSDETSLAVDAETGSDTETDIEAVEFEPVEMASEDTSLDEGEETADETISAEAESSTDEPSEDFEFDLDALSFSDESESSEQDDAQSSDEFTLELGSELESEEQASGDAAAGHDADDDSSRLAADLIAEAEDLLPSFDVLSDEQNDEQDDRPTETEDEAQSLVDESDSTSEIDLSEDLATESEPEATAPHDAFSDDEHTGVELDPVLLEIFQAEVNSHIGRMRAYLSEVADADAQVPATEELLRAVHTLHGAAAMVDAAVVSDVTGPLEAYVKRLRLLDAAPSEGGLVTLGAAATVIGALARAIGSEADYLPDTQGLINNLNDLRDALPEPGEGASLFGMDDAEDMPDEADTQERSSEPPVQDIDEDSPEDDASEIEEQSTASDTSDEAEGEWDLSGADFDLGDSTATDESVDEKSQTPTETVEDDMSSEIESLELSSEGEDALQVSGEGIEVEEVDEIPEQWLSEGDQESRTSGVSVADTEETDEDTSADRADDSAHELTEVAAEVEVEAEHSAAEQTEESAEAVDDHTLTTGEEQQAPEDSAPSDSLIEVDDELLEIFLQEGNEILDEADSRMANWRDAPESMELIAGLQRDLHTLKGGARMAGLSPIGDLSHAMESVFTEVAEDNLEVSRTMIEVLEHAFDRLHGMLEKVNRRESVEMPKSAMMELEALLPSGVRRDLDDDEDSPPAPETKAEVIDFPKVRPGSEADEEQAQALPLRAQEIIRVRSDLLDNLVNYAGEVSIYRSRLEQQVGNYRFNLTEFEQTVTRLREQLRKLEIETEAQILSRFQREAEEQHGEDFDPLELDRFSQIQQLSRALAESVSDLVSIQGMLDDITSQSETLLLQQSRVSSDLQEGLMRTRMVPFESLVPRLRRILRQACQELGKRAQLRVEGAQGEMDRTVLERITAPLEHMLRNAVAHGIESPEQRESDGKPAEGTIHIEVSREATEVVLDISDDGGGINLDAVRDRALERGMLIEGAEFTDRDLLGFILETGFSTADTVTKLAGRGVGLDVVNSEIKQLGGSLAIDTDSGKGSSFEVRLPFTLAVTHAIMVRVGDTHFAVPLSGIQSVVRLSQDEFDERVRSGNPVYQFAGLEHQIMDLNVLLGLESQHVTEDDQVPLLMVRVGDRRAAVRVDSVLDAREIVVKSVGPQVSTVPGIYGATILGDGSVVLILDLSPLVRRGAALQLQLDTEVTPFVPEAEVAEDRMPLVMVVDDSITMRKVTSRVLERNEMEVITAKDGVDALTQLQERVPDVMLLDIEMPRMDGYELATIMRNDTRLAAVPIIMITSRTGEKHRQRAFDIGVERYLGKPYQEGDLLSNITELLERESGDTH